MPLVKFECNANDIGLQLIEEFVEFAAQKQVTCKFETRKQIVSKVEAGVADSERDAEKQVADAWAEHRWARFDDASCNPDGVRPTEVVLGLNPTLEGDGTALYLADELKKRGVAVTRLARGLPSGGQLEYVSKAVLADAIAGRQRMD